AVSTCRTVDPVRSSMSCSPYQSAGLTYQAARSSSPRRYVLDSGGRPKGMPGSAPRSTMRPRHPSSRRVTAAWPPASPAPTMTTTWSLVVLAFIVKNPHDLSSQNRYLERKDLASANTMLHENGFLSFRRLRFHNAV